MKIPFILSILLPVNINAMVRKGVAIVAYKPIVIIQSTLIRLNIAPQRKIIQVMMINVGGVDPLVSGGWLL